MILGAARRNRVDRGAWLNSLDEVRPETYGGRIVTDRGACKQRSPHEVRHRGLTTTPSTSVMVREDQELTRRVDRLRRERIPNCRLRHREHPVEIGKADFEPRRPAVIALPSALGYFHFT